tara:strand:- start:1351 stop:3459 length:2109 start_codon:yes stop_codon:yes gene_type:complete
MLKHPILFAIICFFTVVSSNNILSQTHSKSARHSLSQSDRLVFDQASMLTEEGIYHEAARIWKGLVDDYPNCGNYRYHYAVCLLNSGAPVESVNQELTTAMSMSGSLISGSGKFNEDICEAPVDVLVYASQVKMLLLEFDDALRLLSRFNVEAKKWNPLRRNADHLLSNIDMAQNLIASPIDVQVRNMGPLINTEFDDTHPVIRADEKQLFYSSQRARSNGSNHGSFDPNTKDHYADIYVSERDSAWGEAEWVNIGLKKHKFALAISPFGEDLSIAHVDGWDELVFHSNKRKGKWQKAVASSVIPDAPSEGVIVFSPNNSIAIMSIADRKGRTGFDLYQYTKLSDGSWSNPELIQGPINSDRNEMSPFISADGTLFFASNRQTSMGGYDCYRSVFENGKWSDPVNLGFPINTVDDDRYFAISAEGTRAYIASRRNRPLNDYDIFEITFTEASQIVNGNIMLLNAPLEVDFDRITLTSLQSGNTDDVMVSEDNEQFLRAVIYGGQSYIIDYFKDGAVMITDTLEIATDAGYHVYTDPIDSFEAGISGDGSLRVEKYVEPEPELIDASMSLEDSLELLSLFGPSPEAESWISVFKLNSLQIHTPGIDITSMANEVLRRINEERHPELLVSSSAFRDETTSFEDANAFSGKRSANVFIRLKKILLNMGYTNKVDYTFLPFEIKVVTDPDDDTPDYVKITITSSLQ